jgi:hypothetical protein
LGKVASVVADGRARTFPGGHEEKWVFLSYHSIHIKHPSNMLDVLPRQSGRMRTQKTYQRAGEASDNKTIYVKHLRHPSEKTYPKEGANAGGRGENAGAYCVMN